MGQCMSRKAATAFAASAVSSQNRPLKKHPHFLSPDEDNNKESIKKTSGNNSATRGVAMSFGFKRRPKTAPSIASNASAARRLANSDDTTDNNGNEDETTPLTLQSTLNGRSTPRLQPPKKEPIATRGVSRFGFRQPQSNRTNRVADLNSRTNYNDFGATNNNLKYHTQPLMQPRSISATLDAQNRTTTTYPAASGAFIDNNRNMRMISKYTLQATSLPRPQPVKVLETKAAKTLANTNMKLSARRQTPDSSKDGSLTEDSGLGSNAGGHAEDADDFEYSDRLSSKRRRQVSRNLDVTLTGHTFDVGDVDDSFEDTLPKLPSAFHTVESKTSPLQPNTGFVRDRAMEYQKKLDRKISQRTLSSTSSSEENGEDEFTLYKDKYNTEKFLKSAALKTLKKVKPPDLQNEASNSANSSDEHDWNNAGEAMAAPEELNFSMSSSDESREALNRPTTLVDLKITKITTQKSGFKNVTLTIEDKFATAVAAANIPTSLIEDETSPVDSVLSFTESEEILKKKLNHSVVSTSKDINEKATPSSSPGTPTNASNSFSDGKDDFLIDDEIADQPGLVFERTLTRTQSQNLSEHSITLIESTPKPIHKKQLDNFEASPLMARNKKFLQSRTISLDTLSPCESIASDDLMIDYDCSQSSGLDDCDRTDRKSGYLSLNDTVMITSLDVDNKNAEIMRNWSSLLNCDKNKSASRSRLLRSRTGTPNSIPDSPRSLDGRVNARQRTATNSPLRHSRLSILSNNGYDSDDSVRSDKFVQHNAMKQDLISVKTMLYKLRRVLNEQTSEDLLLRAETHNPFDNKIQNLVNGHLNGIDSDDIQNEDSNSKFEMAELRRQVLFLQGQLEDKEKTVQRLTEEVIKISNENYNSNSAPASTVAESCCNAATQTERIRPISAGPSMLNGSSPDAASLVSANEQQQRKSRTLVRLSSSPSPSGSNSPLKLWRKPGEPASPQRYANGSISNSSKKTNGFCKLSPSIL